MVVVMSSDASPSDIDAVVELVRAAGGEAFVSRGVSRTIVGLVGDVEQFGTLNLQGLPGVTDVVRISVPYKLVSREHHRPRSHSTMSRLPRCAMYSAAISHSSMVAFIPRLSITGLPAEPTACSSGKFCMFLVPTCSMSA